MNDWVTDPLAWDDAKVHDRGKVLTAEQLDAADEGDWGRYRDIDGDGIPYRTLPGTHPTKGAFFTRGTTHDENARYTEDGAYHARVLDRIRRKFETRGQARCRSRRSRSATPKSKIGVIYFGATRPAVQEALDLLERDGVRLNAMRIRAFPFATEVKAFCAAHDQIFVVEQNRDAQMRSLLMIEADVPGDKLVPALNYDGYADDRGVRARRRPQARCAPRVAAAE